MQILVTGGLGYIGSHTVLKLLDNNFDVVIVDNLSNSHIGTLSVLEKLAKKKIPFYHADLRNKKAVSEIFSKNTIDAVIHFAALKAVGESVEIPLKYYENNLGGVFTLLSVMESFSVKKIIFSSSATVYGNSEKVPLKETEPTSATNPYGRTKLFIEEILKDLCAAKTGWSATSLRYFNPLGAHESGDLGEDPNGIPSNLAPFITQVAVGKLEKLYVFGNDYNTPDGTCIRDFIHVDDLTLGHVFALNNLTSGFEAINLGSGKGYSVFELIHNFEKVIGQKIPYEISGRRAGDVAYSYADIQKAKKLLLWQPTKDIDKMCLDSWNWQKKHPNGRRTN